MESMATTEVNLESPAARSAAGVIKLMDQSGICAIALIRLMINGMYNFLRGVEQGNKWLKKRHNNQQHNEKGKGSKPQK